MDGSGLGRVRGNLKARSLPRPMELIREAENCRDTTEAGIHANFACTDSCAAPMTQEFKSSRERWPTF